MKQTIEIEVPDGKKAVWKNNKIIFEDIKSQLPNTWEEFCKNYPCTKKEYFLDIDSNSCPCIKDNICRYEEKDRNVLPNKQAAEQHLALMQLHQLRDCYRQGWKPDNTHVSFGIKNINNRIMVDRYMANSSKQFLSFQSREIAEKFLDNFYELIEQAGDLI